MHTNTSTGAQTALSVHHDKEVPCWENGKWRNRRVRDAAQAERRTAAALGELASFAAPGMAADTIKVGAGNLDRRQRHDDLTSNLTIAQLAKLQGVPATTVQLELDGVAANTPAAAAVKA